MWENLPVNNLAYRVSAKRIKIGLATLVYRADAFIVSGKFLSNCKSGTIIDFLLETFS